MRIVIASGGLGNTMSQYAFVMSLRKHDNQKCALFVAESNMEHYGYELEKIFPNVIKCDKMNVFQRIYINILSSLRNVKIGKRYFPHQILFCFHKRMFTPEAIWFYPEVYNKQYRNAYFLGQFQSYKYLENCELEVRNAFEFDLLKLSNRTKELSKLMEEVNSVSLHVRRGDYQNAYYINGLGNVVTLDYYKRAINYIKQKIHNPVFFVFSDDLEYVKSNILLDNVIYVDFNRGDNSWQDMYLMSKCKHNIIANSTFSWWGAWLNNNESKIIVAPQKWWATLDKDDLIPTKWIRI